MINVSAVRSRTFSRTSGALRRLPASRSYSSPSRISSSLRSFPSGSSSSSTSSFAAPSRARLIASQHRAHPAFGVRALSLWPSSNSPAPIIGNDGKLLDKSQVASSSATTSNTVNTPIAASEELGVDFQAATEASNASTPSLTSSEVARKIENIPSELAESIEETRRTLSDYGIGGGGIVGRMQELLEWTHLTTGLPWYLTIGAVVLTVRMALFPIMVRGISNNARMARIQPQMMDNIAQIKRAKEDGNQYEMQRLQLETKQLFVDNNCGPLRGLIPPLFQMPLFIVFFLAIRGMANAGLPDFSTGGIAWFTDLSAPDPYYVLPILSSAATLATLQVGEYGMPEKAGFAKGFISAIKLATPLIVWFTSSFPAAVLVYWVTHNSFSILQTLILRLPAFKRWADIPDPPPRDPTKPRSNPLSFTQAIKDTTEAFADVKQKAIERTEARIESQAPVTRQKAWDNEATAYEKRKKAAAAALQDMEKPAFDTTAQAGVLEESVTQVEGITASTQRQAIKMTPAQAAEEARRIRVADARKRREQHRQRKSRL